VEGEVFPILSALWLGILTSTSPCPLASNIAAVAFISKRIIHIPYVVISGLLYTTGRVVGYAALGFLITSSLLTIPGTAMFLQNSMNKILGPILVITGLFLLEFISVRSSGLSIIETLASRLQRFGVMGSLLLGVLFSLLRGLHIF